jgi:hypothetical protein
VECNPTLASISRSQDADTLVTAAGRVVGTQTSTTPRRSEVSGSLLFMQPGAGNLEYGTFVTPFAHSDAQLQ